MPYDMLFLLLFTFYFLFLFFIYWLLRHYQYLIRLDRDEDIECIQGGRGMHAKSEIWFIK